MAYLSNISLTFFTSAGSIMVKWVKWRLRLVAFLVRMWRLNACFLFTFPVPVMVKRFLALELVFIFGMTIQYMPFGRFISFS